MFSLQAQKAERDATDLKGSMRKRMEFLDFDWLILPWYEVMPCPQILVRLWPKYERCRVSLPDLHHLSGGGRKRTVATVWGPNLPRLGGKSSFGSLRGNDASSPPYLVSCSPYIWFFLSIEHNLSEIIKSCWFGTAFFMVSSFHYMCKMVILVIHIIISCSRFFM